MSGEDLKLYRLQRTKFGDVRICFVEKSTERSKWCQWVIVVTDPQGEAFHVARHRNKQDAIKEFKNWIDGKKRGNCELGKSTH